MEQTILLELDPFSNSLNHPLCSISFPIWFPKGKKINLLNLTTPPFSTHPSWRKQGGKMVGSSSFFATSNLFIFYFFICIYWNNICLYISIFFINGLNFIVFIQEVENQIGTWDGYVDYRNRPALKGFHGGMLAASFVLGK